MNIEDAHTIGEYEVVVFADASVENIRDFSLSRVAPKSKADFSMHSIPVGLVVHLCHQLYQKKPKAYLLHIKAYQFDFLEPLTNQASDNLRKAVDFLKMALADIDHLPNFLDGFIAINQKQQAEHTLS
ncbi:MAG: hypothetical protein HC819_15635 [Cyclobacteriaceae bacterium]|nr:hypothetical protein [Cyclobacteriaceae bacterium]